MNNSARSAAAVISRRDIVVAEIKDQNIAIADEPRSAETKSGLPSVPIIGP